MIMKTINKLICKICKKLKFICKKYKIILYICFFLSVVLVIAGIIVFYVPYYIIPNNIDGEINSQYDAVFQEVSENIEVTKEQKDIYLNRIIENIDVDTKNSEKEYQWMQKDGDNFSDLDETQVFFDESKNYDTTHSYDCKTYKYSYASSELRQGWFCKYYVLDENGQNINGESFLFDKYLNENITRFTNDTIDQKKSELKTKYKPINLSLYMLSFLLSVSGLWLLVLCICEGVDTIKDKKSVKNIQKQRELK